MSTTIFVDNIKTNSLNIGNATSVTESDAAINFPAGTTITDLIPSVLNLNLAYGKDTLFSTTTGNFNTAIGYQALYLNETGDRNTALGYQALYNNTATANTAIGYNALVLNTSGLKNTAVGSNALANNLTTNHNTAVGGDALFSNEAIGNVGIGSSSLRNNITGDHNVGLGRNSGMAIITGSNNTMIGAYSNVDSDDATNRIAIGYSAVCTADNTAVIGNGAISQVSTGSGSNLAGVTTQSTGIAPTTTPNYIGQIIIDTSTNKVYISSGTTSSSDWILLN